MFHRLSVFQNSQVVHKTVKTNIEDIGLQETNILLTVINGKFLFFF